MSSTFLIYFLFFLFLVLTAAFLIFDQLVKLEYRKYRTEWEKDGKPHGFFWKPPESPLVRGAMATNRLSLYWLFRSPAWMKQNPSAVSLAKWLRICVAIWNLGIIVLVVLMLSGN
jgi:hypothetical protein